MSAIDFQEFAKDLAFFSVFGGFLGAFTWGVVAEALDRLTERFCRKHKATPAQLLSIAAAMRKRSSQLVMQAEALRAATLPK